MTQGDQHTLSWEISSLGRELKKVFLSSNQHDNTSLLLVKNEIYNSCSCHGNYCCYYGNIVVFTSRYSTDVVMPSVPTTNSVGDLQFLKESEETWVCVGEWEGGVGEWEGRWWGVLDKSRSNVEREGQVSQKGPNTVLTNWSTRY